MNINGFWYRPNNSTRQTARLQIENQSYQLFVADEIVKSGFIGELTLSNRVGDAHRKITWPDHALFESSENDAIDSAFIKDKSSSTLRGLLHRLESHWGWVISALIITVLVSFAGVRYGIPAASEKIAAELPQSFNKTVSQQALSTLDRSLFSPSKLDLEAQATVQAQFDQLISKLPYEDIAFNLHFRQMRGIPNAMALPGGDIVVTDDFINLIEHPEELDSVLLHEIGHVIAHHGMTQVIRASAVSVIVTLALGDLSAMGDLAVGLPVFIMQNSYSQNAETEADEYAFKRMTEMGKDPKYFADIILRLSDKKLDDQDTEDKSSYLSTHPNSVIRARNAIEASKRD